MMSVGMMVDMLVFVVVAIMISHISSSPVRDYTPSTQSLTDAMVWMTIKQVVAEVVSSLI